MENGWRFVLKSKFVKSWKIILRMYFICIRAIASASQQLIGNIGYNLKVSFVKKIVENFMNNSMDNSIKNFRDNFRCQFQDNFRYNFNANARDNFRTIFQNLSVIVQLMELQYFVATIVQICREKSFSKCDLLFSQFLRAGILCCASSRPQAENLLPFGDTIPA